MARVIWTGPAIADLFGIADYIANSSTTAADAVIERLFAAPNRLEMFPLAGAVVEKLEDRGVREVLCGTYRLLYVCREDICYITAIIHSSRDLARLIEPRMWEPEP